MRPRLPLVALAVVALVVLVASAAWLAWSQTQANALRERAARDAAAAAAAAEGASSTRSDAQAASAPGSKPEEIDASSTRSVARSRGAAERDFAGFSSESVPLSVVLRDGGRPAAGAQAFTFEWSDDRDAYNELDRRERGELETWLVEHGRNVALDEHGVGRAPRALQSSIAIARADGLFGVVEFAPEDDTVVVELAPERTCEVRVATRAGEGVPDLDVVLTPVELPEAYFLARTDAAGVARFRHLAAHGAHLPPTAWELSVGALVATRPTERFAALDAAPERVELVLPPCGALEVVVVDRDGRTPAEPCDVQVEIATDEFAASSVGPFTTESSRGRFRFSPVEVGAPLVLTAWTALGREFVVASHVGPDREGETASVRLVLAPEPALVLRAVDEAGAALARCTLRARTRLGSAEDEFAAPQEVREIETDDDGRFRLPFVDDALSSGGLRALELWTTRERDGAELGFRTVLERTFSDQDVDLGDAAFVPFEQWVAGRVVDDAGEAVAGAVVELYTFDAAHADVGAPSPAWIESDERGEFVVRGPLAPQRVRLIANRGRPRESAPVDVVVSGEPRAHDAHDVVLVVPRTGALAGTLLLDEGVLASDLTCRWSSGGGEGVALAVHEVQPEAAAERGLARFAFEELPVAAGELTVLAGARVVARVDSVEIEPGATNGDPRLQRLDLRGALRVVTVDVALVDGTPAPSGRVRTLESGAQSGAREWPIAAGRARCVVGAEPIDLTILATGARVERVAGVAERACTVSARAPYELELAFQCVSLPAELALRLDPREGEPSLVSLARPAGGDAGFVANCADVGRCRVRLVRPASAERGVDARALGEWTIDVADVDAPQRFSFELEPAAVEALLR
jgi:hypothetical protein